ncbi:MAG: M48 family metalloprotease [Amaricoccus sp.]|uniref:M48 family metalloprotease n=1 Tax=Amaricoccus sp. TaxID=1872485 RepID=UPI0039E21EA9
MARTVAALALAAVLAQACAPGPPAGVAPVSEVEARLLTASGGLYPDDALASYVRGVGMSLVRAAGLPRDGWQFLVLDTPEANAYSLPGNRIYVTRGMLALANDEAELATVLAHEIGHAVSGDADHDAPDAERRASEFRADRLGMGYLVRAGYDAEAQVDFLRTLLAQRRLAFRLAGVDPRTEASAPSNHPALADRLVVARREAAGASGRRGRDAYLAAIDGLVWGDGPSQGFVDGQTFFSPKLGFAFDAPIGYGLTNRKDSVTADGSHGAMFLLDSVADPGGSPVDYLALRWVPKIAEDIGAGPVTGLQSIQLNGLEAARGRVMLHDGRSERVADLTVVRLGGRLYRLTGLRRTGDATAAAALAATAASFHAVDPAEARTYQPPRLLVHQITPGEDVRALAEAMPVDAPRATFDMLNELRPGRVLREGDVVKLVD